MTVESKNTFRLSVQYVGFQVRRAQYRIHINCPCNLKKSLAGTYATEQACRDAVPGKALTYMCAKSQPVVPEEIIVPKPGRHAKRNAKTRFIKEVATAIKSAEENGSTYTAVGDLIVRVERENGAYKALTITDPQNNSFEFRCPFSARNAGEIATQVWNLMKTMMG